MIDRQASSRVTVCYEQLALDFSFIVVIDLTNEILERTEEKVLALLENRRPRVVLKRLVATLQLCIWFVVY